MVSVKSSGAYPPPPSDTLVAMDDGYKRIDEIEIGDLVWAYNIETGELELKEVLTVYVKENKEILHLETSIGNIDTTTNHPFYVIDEGWVAAGDLEVGDEVYTLDGSISVITGYWLEVFDAPVTVYNLEVDGFHTYFAGEFGVLVHNICNRTPKSNVDRKVQNPDGSTTYTKTGPDGKQYSVTYNKDNYPDFSPYAYNGNGGSSSTDIGYTGNRRNDFRLANEGVSLPNTPEGYTWHHVENAKTMQLILTIVHDLFPHTGGFSIFKSGKY